jgi:hypothetical protein
VVYNELGNTSAATQALNFMEVSAADRAIALRVYEAIQ